MKSIKDWYSSKELEGLKGLPSLATNITRKAKKESWKRQNAQGIKGGGFEYHYSSLPKETKQELGFEYSAHPEVDNNELETEASEVAPSLDDEYDFIIGYNVQAAAGNGIINHGSFPSRSLAFRKKWLRYRQFSTKELVLIWAKGDSMYPTLQDNDTLVVHIMRKKPVDGRIYVIRKEEELLVKRIQLLPNGLRLISDNKEMYAPVDITDTDLDNFEVVGQVVHVAHDFPD